MPFELKKQAIKEIPFREGQVLRFQLGTLLSPNGQKRMRYTRSMDLVRARYRITLQYEGDHEHIPYVFDAIRSAKHASLEIRPDSDPARQVWLIPTDPRRKEFEQAIETIFQKDIECAPE